jgi:hypothetical protein
MMLPSLAAETKLDDDEDPPQLSYCAVRAEPLISQHRHHLAGRPELAKLAIA